jgi:hypothetical protein
MLALGAYVLLMVAFAVFMRRTLRKLNAPTAPRCPDLRRVYAYEHYQSAATVAQYPTLRCDLEEGHHGPHHSNVQSTDVWWQDEADEAVGKLLKRVRSPR